MQVLENFEVVIQICKDTTQEFAEDIRTRLKEMIENDQDRRKIQIELALLKDCATSLCKFCYAQESDEDLLCVETYHHWETVTTDLGKIVVHNDIHKLPTTIELISQLAISKAEQDVLLEDSITLKIKPIYDKILGDSKNRLDLTLNILKGCQLFDYRYIATLSMLTLTEISVQLQFIPAIDEVVYSQLVVELPDYHEKAIHESTSDSQISCWNFFVKYKTVIKVFYTTARDAIALITPSSAACERVLAIYTESFSDNQGSALADLREGTVLCKVNLRERYKEREKLKAREGTAARIINLV
jgi:hypothetical protein